MRQVASNEHVKEIARAHLANVDHPKVEQDHTRNELDAVKKQLVIAWTNGRLF